MNPYTYAAFIRLSAPVFICLSLRLSILVTEALLLSLNA